MKNMLMVILVIFVVTLVSHISAATEFLTDRPIVGIFTQPTSDGSEACGQSCYYLAASYVKYIESAGARVVPVPYNASTEQLDFLFESLNGFFFPGGGAAYPSSAQYIYDKVVKANDAGDKVPLHGTCMGFQWLLIAQSHDGNILDPSDGTQMDAYNLSIPLDLKSAAYSSKLFSNAGRDLMNILGTEPVTMNNHHYGIWTDHWESTESLTSFFDVLSTNKDRNGDEFISTIVAKNYPIFGSQWHPEKNTFEWGLNADGTPKEAINHSPDAVAAAQYMANFFVQQARMNTHKFANTADEKAALIWNYQCTYTDYYSDFVEKYYFPK